jgi:hypothetical protein
MKQVLVPVAIVAALLGIASFVLFVTDTAQLHGSALGGRVADGHWFVADHGRETEVSQAAWERNRVLAFAFFVAFPLGMVANLYLVFGFFLPRAIFRATAEEREARVREVVASGPRIALTKVGARIGVANLGGGMLVSSVHPGGLVLRARFVGAAAVRRSEIRSVQEKTGFLARGLAIEHTSAHIRSPILLARGADPKFIEALRQLAPAA